MAPSVSERCGLSGKVLILGGYGNFGKRIARALAAPSNDGLPEAGYSPDQEHRNTWGTQELPKAGDKGHPSMLNIDPSFFSIPQQRNDPACLLVILDSAFSLWR